MRKPRSGFASFAGSERHFETNSVCTAPGQRGWTSWRMKRRNNESLQKRTRLPKIVIFPAMLLITKVRDSKFPAGLAKFLANSGDYLSSDFSTSGLQFGIQCKLFGLRLGIVFPDGR